MAIATQCILLPFVTDDTGIRITNETPSRLSVIDVIKAMTGKDANQAAEVNRRISQQNHEIAENIEKIKLTDNPKHPTPVANLPTIMSIIMVITGKKAAQARGSIAHHLCRFFAGDQTLHAEIDRLAASDHPLAQLARETIHQGNPGNDDRQYPRRSECGFYEYRTVH